MMTDNSPKDSPQHKGIPVHLDRYDNMAVHRTKESRPAVDGPLRRRRQGKDVSSERGEIEARSPQPPQPPSPTNQRIPSPRNMIPMYRPSHRTRHGGGGKNISPDASERNESFSLVRRTKPGPLDTRLSASLPGPTFKGTSPRLPDGYSIVPLPASNTSAKSIATTERASFLKFSEKHSDASSSVVSTRSASTSSRASGESHTDVMSHVRMTPHPGGSAHLTSPRNQKHGTGLPSVRSMQLMQARRSSEPVISSSSTNSEIFSSQQSTDQAPVREQCWTGRTHRDIPVIKTSQLARLERTKSHPQLTTRTYSGNPKQKGQVHDSSKHKEEEKTQEETDEEDDGEDSTGLDRKVLTWLDGLDSATCRRFMRRQMASLQEVDDH